MSRALTRASDFLDPIGPVHVQPLFTGGLLVGILVSEATPERRPLVSVVIDGVDPARSPARLRVVAEPFA